MIPDVASTDIQVALESGFLNIETFNCKNINTCQMVSDELGKSADFILIQEHWLFNCNLHKLKEISSSYTGTGKSIDTGNLILPVQMPRGMAVQPYFGSLKLTS